MCLVMLYHGRVLPIGLLNKTVLPIGYIEQDISVVKVPVGFL